MRAPPININTLVTIADHLKALVTAEDTITEITRQLDTHLDGEAEWRQRANVSLKFWRSSRRRITSRLAVLRHEEKVRNVAIHQHVNDYLIDEMKRYFPKAAFQACVHRAKIKAGVSQ